MGQMDGARIRTAQLPYIALRNTAVGYFGPVSGLMSGIVSLSAPSRVKHSGILQICEVA